MARQLPSKPRYKISYRGRSKIWFTKDSRLRRFFSIRGRQLVRRRRLFTRLVLVSNKIKWVIARRFLRPYRRPKFARPRRLSYRHNFYAKQRFRAFFGKVEEQGLRQLYKITKNVTIKINSSFFVMLESRLDVVLYRRRFLPTIFACNQFIRTQGILLGNNNCYEPHITIRPGTLLSIAPKYWTIIYEHRLTRVFYRVYGKWIMQVRRRRLFAKKFRWILRSLRRKRRPYYPVFRWLKLVRLFKLLRKTRLKNISAWRFAFTRLYLVKPTEMLEFARNLNRLEKLTFQIARNLRLHGRRLNCLRKRRYFSGKSFKSISSGSVIAYAYTFAITQQRLTLIHLRDTLEQQFCELAFSNLSTLSLGPDLDSSVTFELSLLLKQRRFWLSQRFVKDTVRLKLQISLFLRKRIQSKFFRKKKRYKALTKKRRKSRGASIRYFLLLNRYKKRRRRRLPRLKKVHWHIPSYRHLDPQTLQVAIVRAPQASELHYPFRCSPSKIVSFYKSRGF